MTHRVSSRCVTVFLFDKNDSLVSRGDVCSAGQILCGILRVHTSEIDCVAQAQQQRVAAAAAAVAPLSGRNQSVATDLFIVFRSRTSTDEGRNLVSYGF